MHLRQYRAGEVRMYRDDTAGAGSPMLLVFSGGERVKVDFEIFL